MGGRGRARSGAEATGRAGRRRCGLGEKVRSDVAVAGGSRRVRSGGEAAQIERSLDLKSHINSFPLPIITNSPVLFIVVLIVLILSTA